MSKLKHFDLNDIPAKTTSNKQERMIATRIPRAVYDNMVLFAKHKNYTISSLTCKILTDLFTDTKERNDNELS